MRIFDRYLGGKILGATLTAVLMLSGVLVLGNVFKRLDQLVGNANLPIGELFNFVLYVLPFSLVFTIPWGFLTAILLVFGRLSADNELISMRMAGLSMLRISMPVFAIALTLSGACLWINTEISPRAQNSMKTIFYDLAVKDASSIFMQGRVLDKIPDYLIFTEEKEADDLKNLQIVQYRKSRPVNFFVAKEGEVQSDPEGLINLALKEVTALNIGENGAIHANLAAIRFETMNLPLSLQSLKDKISRVSIGMKTTRTLMKELDTGINQANAEELEPKEISSVRTEVNKRFSFSLACLTFAFIGIPLGITAQRRETSAGFALSLVVASVYFLLIILVDGMREKAQLKPEILIWLPNIIFLVIGLILFYRLSKR